MSIPEDDGYDLREAATHIEQRNKVPIYVLRMIIGMLVLAAAAPVLYDMFY